MSPTLKEYLALHEVSMQGALLKAFKPHGTFADLYGDAETLADMLDAKTTDTVYILKPDTPAQKSAAHSVLRSYASRLEGNFSLIKLVGDRKVVHDGTHIITSQKQLDRFVP